MVEEVESHGDWWDVTVSVPPTTESEARLRVLPAMHTELTGSSVTTTGSTTIRYLKLYDGSPSASSPFRIGARGDDATISEINV